MRTHPLLVQGRSSDNITLSHYCISGDAALLTNILCFIAGAFVVWFFARRQIRFANAQRVGAERLRTQLIEFCDNNGITVRPWDVPPFSLDCPAPETWPEEPKPKGHPYFDK